MTTSAITMNRNIAPALKRNTELYLGSKEERAQRIDLLYNSIKDVPYYGTKITRNGIKPQAHGIAMDIANSAYVLPSTLTLVQSHNNLRLPHKIPTILGAQP